MTITLYDSALSGNAHKIRLALAWIGLPHATVAATGDYRATAEFRSINPLGQVPVLVDGDLVLRDSQAILAYLAAAHRPGEWDGHDPAERGRIGQWLSLAANEIANGPALLRLERRFGATIDRPRAAAITERILPVLAGQLDTRDWLEGARMTIADIACAPYLALGGEGGIDLTPWPAITRWLDRIAALPGFVAMPGWGAPI